MKSYGYICGYLHKAAADVEGATSAAGTPSPPRSVGKTKERKSNFFLPDKKLSATEELQQSLKKFEPSEQAVSRMNKYRAQDPLYRIGFTDPEVQAVRGPVMSHWWPSTTKRSRPEVLEELSRPRAGLMENDAGHGIRPLPLVGQTEQRPCGKYRNIYRLRNEELRLHLRLPLQRSGREETTNPLGDVATGAEPTPGNS
jgi:hypothetical protein